MRRFQVLVMLAAVAAAGIWWGFYRSRHTSSAAVTSLLPKETLALLHLPDFNRTRMEWRQTDLYQIWTEPAVQDFLQEPRAKIPPSSGFASIIQECESLQIRDAFLAVVAIENSAWKTVAGFRFKGDPSQAETIVMHWKARALAKMKDRKTETLDYQGHQIHADTAGIVRLYSARDNQWFFAANDIDQLKQLLDRVDGRRNDSNTALAADDVFAAAFKHMPSIYTALGFVRVDQLVDKLIPGPENEESDQTDPVAAVRQIRSLCGATAFDGGRIRDAVFVGMPRLPDAGILTRGSLPIATKDTFLFATGFLNLIRSVPLANSQAVLGWMGGLEKITTILSADKVALENWKRAFDSELSWVGLWPRSSHWPSFFAALPVRDSTKAREILAKLITTDSEPTEWRQQEKDGVQYFSTRAGGRLLSLSPTIGLSERFLVAGPNTELVEAAIKRISGGNSELAGSRIFKTAERAVPAAQQMFTYVDSALIYTRVDAALRPVLVWSTAFLPGIADTIDPSKWPAPEAITKHLSPIVMSQRYDGDGYISESVGPLTVYQAIIGVGGIGGAAYFLYDRQTQKSALPLIPAAIVPQTSITPSPSPDESP